MRFIEGLDSLADVDTDDYLSPKLYDLCELLKDEPDASSVIPRIFAFFRTHPDADFGTPGPLIHFLESRPDYEDHLVESLEMKPTVPTVQMLNRILNSNISDAKRSSLLALLRAASTHPNADEVAREQAEHYLTFQAKRRES
jgi:hypothetical protein